jgi:GNAT superfamily N-acetyltransferase
MTVQPMLPIHAPALAALQELVFPTLAAVDRIRAEQYLRHPEVFPEGQFLLTTGGASDGDHQTGGQIIGSTTTMRTTFDFDKPRHRFRDTFGGGWLIHHQPGGDWLYGLDMSIHPAWRGRGGARLLYRARHQLVRHLGLRGQLTVGMPSGYGALRDQFSGEEYYQQWLAGLRTDPTLTPQQKIGFRPVALIPDYLDDPVCGNFGVLLRLDIGEEV